MKIKNTYFRLALLCLPFLFTNCSKDDEDISAEQKEEIITSTTWEINDIAAHVIYNSSFAGFEEGMDSTFSVVKNLPECEYDIDYNFLISGILQYTPSETYCGEDINGNFTWDLSDSGNELTILGDEGALFVTTSSGTIVKEDLVLQIIEINENILKCRMEIPLDEFIGMYFDEFSLDLMEEMGISMTGSMEVDYTFVAKQD